jgi:hypothetical protein
VYEGPSNISLVHFSSQASSFFSYTSGRGRRRRQLREQQRKRLQQRSNQLVIKDFPQQREGSRDERKPSVRDILFPNPYRGQVAHNENAFRLPKNFSMFKSAFVMTWIGYRSTWDGFFANRGFLVEDSIDSKEKNKKEQGEEEAEAVETAIEKRVEIAGNAKRNLQFVKGEAESLRKEVSERTGISTTEDLKRVVGDTMRLASDCVQEFMAGYRKGRDEEVDKMLTTYFEEPEEKDGDSTKRRRRPKRRVLKPQYYC